MQINKKKKIFLAGHNGMVGSAILRLFLKKGYKNIICENRRSLDLLDQKKTFRFLKKTKPDFIVIAAAKVGGILVNKKQKAKFIYENLMIQTNLIHSAYLIGVKKLIFLGSSCIYPKFCEQPILENFLLSGKLEETNDAYAIAKIAGVKMCEAYNKQYKTNFICLMPTNLYGPKDNYDLNNSHFFPALISKIINAKKKNHKNITLWGTGKPRREIMYVDDLADACIFFLHKKTKETVINIGTSHDISIYQYAKFILKQINYNCKILLDKSKPTGTMRKLLDCSLAKNYGWKPKISLAEGLKKILENC